jgi:hypothetical protein
LPCVGDDLVEAAGEAGGVAHDDVLKTVGGVAEDPLGDLGGVADEHELLDQFERNSRGEIAEKIRMAFALFTLASPPDAFIPDLVVVGLIVVGAIYFAKMLIVNARCWTPNPATPTPSDGNLSRW